MRLATRDYKTWKISSLHSIFKYILDICSIYEYYRFMKKIFLNNIANIFTGIVLPKDKSSLDLSSNDSEESPFEKIPKREYKIINISDIDDDGNISKSLSEVKLDDSAKVRKYAVTYNNILISSRGTKMKTAIVPETIKSNTLISSNLICIQIQDTSKYPSEVLYFFLRSIYGNKALRKLSSSSEGTVNLNQKILSKLEVPLFEDEKIKEKIIEGVRALNEIKGLFIDQRDSFSLVEKTLEANYFKKYEDKFE